MKWQRTDQLGCTGSAGFDAVDTGDWIGLMHFPVEEGGGVPAHEVVEGGLDRGPGCGGELHEFDVAGMALCVGALAPPHGV